MQREDFNLWTVVGVFFLVLGAIGAVLPLLPTTPFVLVAAWCFARSSPRLHQWLLDSQLFGPILRNWEENRCVPLRAKITALVMMVGVGGTSLVFAVPAGWPRYGGLALIGIGCAVVLSLRTCRPDVDGCEGESPEAAPDPAGEALP